MRIGWITPTVGCFGSIREMVEVSNALVRKGHEVSIYHPDGGDVQWLPSLARCHLLKALAYTQLDVLIGIVDWDPSLYDELKKAHADLKAVCLLGFTPTQELADVLIGKRGTQHKDWMVMRDAIQSMHILADSDWQLNWIKKVTEKSVGPSFGGINIKMFHPGKPRHRTILKVTASGDIRKRKGSDITEEVMSRLKGIKTDTYWGRHFTQTELVEFYQDSDIFIDGHRRGGWCNPVAEAMATGCAVVCTDIGATSSFAIDGETALVVAPDNIEEMLEAVRRLVTDDKLRNKLATNAVEKITEFSYDKVVHRLEDYLLDQLGLKEISYQEN